jgi:hypothetical protein
MIYATKQSFVLQTVDLQSTYCYRKVAFLRQMIGGDR